LQQNFIVEELSRGIYVLDYVLVFRTHDLSENETGPTAVTVDKLLLVRLG